MFPEVPAAFAVLLIAVPPALRWWWGRSLAHAPDDPLLPERLMATGRRAGVVMGTCAATLALVWPSLAVWSVPLLVTLFAVAGFPLRKTLYQETWSLGTYLRYLARLTGGVFGFWILLAATPWLVAYAGRLEWIAAAALAALLLLWNYHYGPILRRVLGTRPIADGVLAARFDALVAAAGIARPRFEYVVLDGGVVANAVALPSLRESAVVFSETLLARLETDEIVAIAAHEIAHLEYYDRARLRRMFLATIVVAAIAAAASPLARAAMGPSFTGWLYLWPCAFVAAFGFRAHRRQQNETASDLRAVALTGDAEALARALTKLHAIARVPRRWDQHLEQRATHPSLARRIRDIRATQGGAPVLLDAPVTFAEAGGPATATFDASGVSWSRTAGITQVTDYAALVELRLDAAFGGGVSLVAVDRAGQRWKMTPRAADVPALQAVLDRVDGRLTQASPLGMPFSPAVARLVAFVAAGFAGAVGQMAFAFAALLGALCPSPILLIAGGAAGLAAWFWQTFNGQAGSFAYSAGLLYAVLGSALVAVGWVRRRERTPGTGTLRVVLAAAALLSLVWIAAGGIAPVRFHQSVHATPGVFVLLAATAAAAFTDRDRRIFRVEAAAGALAAIAILTAGTHWFLVTFGSDPFLVDAPRASMTVVREAPFAQFDIPFGVQLVRLSPGGRVAAAVREEDEDARGDETSRVYHVAGLVRDLLPVQADDLAFEDEARALVLQRANGQLELRDIHVASGAIVWRQPLPALKWGTLSYVSTSRAWTVTGRDERNRLVQMSGTTGLPAVRTFVAPLPDGSGWIESWATDGYSAIAVQKEIERGLASSRWLLWSALLRSQMWSHSQIWHLYGGTRRPIARTLLDTRCVNDAGDASRVLCAAFDGERTRIVAVDTAGTPHPLASIDGRFYPDESAAAGWLTGWAGSAPVAVRLASPEIVRVPDADGERPFTIAVTGTALGAVSTSGSGTQIRVYPLR